MILRWWFLIPGIVVCVFLFSVFLRFGTASRLTVSHPLVSRFMRRLPPPSRSANAPVCVLCLVLLLHVIAGSGPQWGEKKTPHYRDARVLALMIDRSGSVNEEQARIFVAALKKLLSWFRESAIVTIVPFADVARPSPLFALAQERQHHNAMLFLDLMPQIDVGWGTEGGWAFFQTFITLMVPGVITQEQWRALSPNLSRWLRERTVREHEKELRAMCAVKDRAAIIATDAIFSEGRLHSEEVLLLYRICGIRVYLLNVKGEDRAYVRAAAEATGGRFEFIPAVIADDLYRFEKILARFFNDVFVVERGEQKTKEVVTLVPRALLFGATGSGFGIFAVAMVLVRAWRRVRISRKERR